MTWAHIVTGSVCVHISAVMLLLPCSPCTAAYPNTQVTAPAIVNISHKRLSNGHRITCLVNPGGLKDETLVYWLADGDFIERKYKNITVKMKEKKRDGETVFLHTKVVFKDFSPKDFHTNFTCVALSPSGFAKENLQIRKVRKS